MSSFSERIAAVMVRVTADVPGTTWSEGSREWETNGSPPRVLWKRTNATNAPAAQLHDRTADFQRAIVGKAQSYSVKLWGVDWPQVDALFAALVRALEFESAGAWSYQGDAPNDAATLDKGEATVATFTLRGHVAEAAPVTVTLSSARVRRTAAATSGDGVLEPGDP